VLVPTAAVPVPDALVVKYATAAPASASAPTTPTAAHLRFLVLTNLRNIGNSFGLMAPRVPPAT
jgi:hypothetical protein